VNASTDRLHPVATVLEPSERRSVDAAGAGLYRALHRESLDEVRRDLKERRISAVILSVTRCVREEPAHLQAVVRDFPRIPTVALVSGRDDTNPAAVLALGNCGVRTLIDVRYASGWGRLRDVLGSEVTSDMDRLALAMLQEDLGGVSPDCWRFFEALFTNGDRVQTVRTLARRLGVLPSTLMSRFFRARLPAPKRYLAFARLVRAARLLENPGLSVADVANHLDYSSPQSFGRHVKTVLAMSATDFRRRFDGQGMLRHFRETLLLPYLPVLHALRPLTKRLQPAEQALVRATASDVITTGTPLAPLRAAPRPTIPDGPSAASLLFAPKVPRLLQ
jgi:AraC-like DNA-binding protein